jgi:hypothetical protein
MTDYKEIFLGAFSEHPILQDRIMKNMTPHIRNFGKNEDVFFKKEDGESCLEVETKYTKKFKEHELEISEIFKDYFVRMYRIECAKEDILPAVFYSRCQFENAPLLEKNTKKALNNVAKNELQLKHHFIGVVLTELYLNRSIKEKEPISIPHQTIIRVPQGMLTCFNDVNYEDIVVDALVEEEDLQIAAFEKIVSHFHGFGEVEDIVQEMDDGKRVLQYDPEVEEQVKAGMDSICNIFENYFKKMYEIESYDKYLEALHFYDICKFTISKVYEQTVKCQTDLADKNMLQIRFFFMGHALGELINKVIAEEESIIFLPNNVLDWLHETKCTDGKTFIERRNITPLKWLQNKQLLRELLTHKKIKGELKIAEIEKRTPRLFIDKDGNPINLANNKPASDQRDSNTLQKFLATL